MSLAAVNSQKEEGSILGLYIERLSFPPVYLHITCDQCLHDSFPFVARHLENSVMASLFLLSLSPQRPRFCLLHSALRRQRPPEDMSKHQCRVQYTPCLSASEPPRGLSNPRVSSFLPPCPFLEIKRPQCPQDLSSAPLPSKGLAASTFL